MYRSKGTITMLCYLEKQRLHRSARQAMCARTTTDWTRCSPLLVGCASGLLKTTWKILEEMARSKLLTEKQPETQRLWLWKILMLASDRQRLKQSEPMLIFSYFLAANNGKLCRQVVSSQLPEPRNELTGYLFQVVFFSFLHYKSCCLWGFFFFFPLYCCFKASACLTVRQTNSHNAAKNCISAQPKTTNCKVFEWVRSCECVSQRSSVSAKCPHTDGKTAAAVIFGPGGSTLWTWE